MKSKYLSFLSILFFTFVSCNKYIPPQPPDLSSFSNSKPKNIILMIGDGMGISQITAGMYRNGNKLNLERIKTIGLHKSYSSDNLVTDSAAGATAFASGIKTYNGAIGVTKDTLPVETILEKAKKNNMATGLVATSTIVHATPASFFSHVKSRQLYEDIAEDFLDGTVDFFVGGGLKYFTSREKDDRNIMEELEAKGYQMSSYFDKNFKNVKIDLTKKFGYLTSSSDPLTVEQGRKYLTAASEKALKFLDQKSDDGFFLMIEGSQIDWGGHANNTNFIITEMIDFDKAIGKVLDFIEKDKETLLIVTADHETGGFALNNGSTMDTIKGAFTSDYHTAALIPVFAKGPGSELFNGIYENTAIYDKMNALMSNRFPN